MKIVSKKQEGITLLITLLLMGVLLGVSASLLNITLKQFQLSGISSMSEIAFQAANAGMECALYNDWVGSEFGIGNGDAVNCFGGIGSNDLVNGTGAVTSGEEQRFRFSWGTNPAPTVCTEFSVYKFYEDPTADGDTNGVPVVVGGVTVRPTPCPEGSVCTVVQSRGYNVACNATSTASRVVEREYMQVY